MGARPNFRANAKMDMPEKGKSVRMIKLADRVSLWWRGRIEAGTQLTEWEFMRGGYDFVGERPWPELVLKDALWADFCRNVQDFDPTAAEYTQALKEALHGRVNVTHRPVSYIDWTGRELLRPVRAFIRFPPIESLSDIPNMDN